MKTKTPAFPVSREDFIQAGSTQQSDLQNATKVIVRSVLFGTALLLAPSANAASSTWVGGGADGSWATASNWNGTSVPGATSGITNADIATFKTAIANTWGNSASNPITIDAGRNISGMAFSGAAGNYFIGSTTGNSLYLSSAGTIQLSLLSSAAGSMVTETINAPLVLEGSYIFKNESASGAVANSGMLVVGGAISGGVTSSITLRLQGANQNANTVSGNISNGSSSSLSITKQHAGTWYLTGNNSFTGNVTVQAGVLGVNSIANKGVNSALGAGQSITLGLANSSTGELLYTGATASSDRNIIIDNGATGGAGIIENSTAGATLTLSGTVTASTPANATSLTLTGVGDGVLSGNIAGTPALSIIKSGTGTWTLSGANTHTGGAQINDGVLALGSGQALGSSGTISFGGGVLKYSAANTTDYSSRFSSAASQAVRVDTNGQNVTFALGITSSGGSLELKDTAAASGTLTLSGSSTYTGATAINNGTLVVSTGGSLGNTAVSVSSSASLKNNGSIAGTVTASGLLSGTGNIAGATVVTGTLAPGNSVGTISTGDLTLTNGTLDIELGRTGGTAVSDLVRVTGLVDLTSANLKLELYSGYSNPLLGDIYFLVDNNSTDSIVGHFTTLDGVVTDLAEGSKFTWNSQQWEITYKADFDTKSTAGGNDLALIAVPEPGTWAMALGGFGLLAFAQRMRRRWN